MGAYGNSLRLSVCAVLIYFFIYEAVSVFIKAGTGGYGFESIGSLKEYSAFFGSFYIMHTRCYFGNADIQSEYHREIFRLGRRVGGHKYDLSDVSRVGSCDFKQFEYAD
nr:hypothetical protein [Treponema socranskii]